MKHAPRVIAAVAVVLMLLVWGCPNDSGSQESASSRSHGEHDHSHGEHSHSHGDDEHGEHATTAHDRDGHEHHGEEGEESGTEIALNETYDEVRHGARLILKYDAQTSSFIGTVENTTDQTLERVRVEVHLSNGKELGPTIPMDLTPGAKTPVQLMATGQKFTAWTAHPEVGSAEHSHGGAGHEHGEHGHVHD